MPNPMMIISAIFSLAMIGSGLHYFYSAAFNPTVFTERMQNSSIINRLYLMATFGCLTSVLIMGFNGLLFWIPLSWGVDYSGEYISIRHAASVMLTMCSLPILIYMENSATNFMKQEELQAQILTLKKQLSEARYKSAPAA